MTVEVGAFDKLTDFLHSPGDSLPDLVELSWHGCFPSLESFRLLRLIEVKEHGVATAPDKERPAPKLEIKLLGRFEVLRDGEPIPDEAWGRRKTKTLLKVLLTDPGRVFTQDQLIDALFGGENVSNAIQNLYSRVSQLRRALEPGLEHGRNSQYINRIGEGYAFHLGLGSWVDIVVFESMLAEAQRAADDEQWEDAIERFETALSLHRGDFLAEDRYADWAERARRQLHERYLDGLTRQAACYAKLGRLRQAISCCQQILSIEPYRESVIRSLMAHQSDAGQRGHAIETYHEGERALREYLDVEPAPETRAAYERIRATSVTKNLDPRRVAVLPFANYSSNSEDEYLADGMTEELIGSLAKIRDLRVIARTSVMRFKGTKQSVSEVARALDVGSVLEGSIRKAGDRVRVCAQLIDTRSEEHVWSNEYEGDLRDTLSIQKNTAREVAHALEIRLASEERRALAPQSIEDVTAHTMYLKGRFFLSQRHVEATIKGKAYLEQAVRLDRSHARAFAALADSCVLDSEHSMPITEAYEAATSAVGKALSIDEELVEEQTTQALIRMAFDGDFLAARRQLERAIASNPSYSVAYDWLGFVQGSVGQYRQAVDSYRTAIALDPLSPYHFFLLARAYGMLNRFDEAFASLNKALEIDPTHTGSLIRMVWCNHLTYRWSTAARWLSELERLHGNLPQHPANLGLHLLYLGDLDSSYETLQRACEAASDGTSFLHYYMEWLAHSLTCARQYREAVALLKQVIEDSPFARGLEQGHVRPLFRMAVALELDGCPKDALEALERASELNFSPETGQTIWAPSGERHMSIWVPAAIGMVHAAMGDLGKAREALDGARTCPKDRGGQSARAVLCFRLGLLDEGFEALNLAIDNHDWFILTIKTHPWFDPVRGDPEFSKALGRVNLSD